MLSEVRVHGERMFGRLALTFSGVLGLCRRSMGVSAHFQVPSLGTSGRGYVQLRADPCSLSARLAHCDDDRSAVAP